MKVRKDFPAAGEVSHEIGLEFGEIGRRVKRWRLMGAKRRRSLHHNAVKSSKVSDVLISMPARLRMKGSL